mmetsp:Transcript_35239/g.88805  ORF Transcript_35239/g.88805 Transcript_35239/m.88805 type:complete len:741 (-) Transcript_35239:182-2404(-)
MAGARLAAGCLLRRIAGRAMALLLACVLLPEQTLGLGDRGKKMYNALFDEAKVVKGCYFKDRRWVSKQSQQVAAGSFLECQQKCQTSPSCMFFTFTMNSTACELEGADAVYVDEDVQGMVAGPKVCPPEPFACTDLPSAAFPGSTPEMSALAWPSHRVPSKLDCWPKNNSGGWYNSCPTQTVLEDTAGGWPGKCSGLQQVVVPYMETCESFCKKKLMCSVWQTTNDTYPKCYHSHLSVGKNCYTGDTGSRAIVAAQRIMHGKIRVLKELVGLEIMGLHKAFDQNYFINVSKDAVRACRNVCYSNVACDYWLYSKAWGCFVEDVKSGWVISPLTTEFVSNSSDFAATVIAGEYVQHVCPDDGKPGIYVLPEPAMTFTVSTTTATTSSSTSPEALLEAVPTERVTVPVASLSAAAVAPTGDFLSEHPVTCLVGAIAALLGMVTMCCMLAHKLIPNKKGKVSRSGVLKRKSSTVSSMSSTSSLPALPAQKDDAVVEAVAIENAKLEKLEASAEPELGMARALHVERMKGASPVAHASTAQPLLASAVMPASAQVAPSVMSPASVGLVPPSFARGPAAIALATPLPTASVQLPVATAATPPVPAPPMVSQTPITEATAIASWASSIAPLPPVQPVVSMASMSPLRQNMVFSPSSSGLPVPSEPVAGRFAMPAAPITSSVPVPTEPLVGRVAMLTEPMAVPAEPVATTIQGLAPQTPTVFDLIDRNHDGVIDRGEFARFLGGRLH